LTQGNSGFEIKLSQIEDRPLSKIFEELADLYIERHRETLELLGIPGFVEECKKGLEEIQEGGGKRLNELVD